MTTKSAVIPLLILAQLNLGWTQAAGAEQMTLGTSEAEVEKTGQCAAALTGISGSEAHAILDSEISAVRAIQQMQLTEEEAQADVLLWLGAIQARLKSVKETTVMDHTTLLHMLRSGFLENIPDPSLTDRVEKTLEASWYNLTAEHRLASELLDLPLPAEILSRATDRERIYHAAVFRSPKGATVSPTMRIALPAMVILAIGLSHSAGIPATEALAGAITGYSVSALVEYATHRWLLHPSNYVMTWLRKLGPRAMHASISHRVEHHGIFSRTKYNRQTNQEWNTAQKNEDGNRVLPARDKIAEKGGLDPKWLHLSKYGMSMNWKEILEASAISIGITAVLSYVLGLDWAGATTAMTIAPLTAVATPLLHPLLHEPLVQAKDQSIAEKQGWIATILSTGYWRMILQLHMQHHYTPSEDNFSLFLPGPDHLFGTLRYPSLETLARMEALSGFLGPGDDDSAE